MNRPSRARMEAAQLRQLQAVLRAILPRNRFYARKLAAAGFSRGRGAASLAELLSRIPFTTKAELIADQSAHPPYGTHHTFLLSRYTRFHQTSATTGTPLRWLDTAADWNAMVENWTQVYRAAGIGGSGADRVFFPFSFGPFIGFWLAFEAAQRLGCLCISGGGLSSAARLRVLIANGATALCCTPTYALRLGEAAREEGISLRDAKVKTLFVAGEPGGSIPAVRERIARLWHGARVLDHHGMTEIGPVTYESLRRPCTLVVMEHAYIAEVIDPVTLREVGIGETGELVLTTLGRNGAPLLRYRTCDLVRKTHFGTKLALAGGILSRTDDMIFVRGVNLFPSAVETVVRSFPEVAEYRVEVRRDRAMTEVGVQIETAPDCRDARGVADRLESAFELAFALRIPVTVVARGTLPQFEMKAKRWVTVAPVAAAGSPATPAVRP